MGQWFDYSPIYLVKPEFLKLVGDEYLADSGSPAIYPNCMQSLAIMRSSRLNSLVQITRRHIQIAKSLRESQIAFVFPTVWLIFHLPFFLASGGAPQKQRREDNLIYPKHMIDPLTPAPQHSLNITITRAFSIWCQKNGLVTCPILIRQPYTTRQPSVIMYDSSLEGLSQFAFRRDVI